MTYTKEDCKKIYAEKLGTVEECLSYIKSGDIVYTTHNHSEPTTILDHIHEIAPGVENVKVWKGRGNKYPFMTDPAMKGHIEMYTDFYGPTFYRESEPLGLVDIVPCDIAHYYSVAVMMHEPNIFYCAVTSMDDEGYVYMGMNHTDECLAIEWALENHKPVIIEVNKNLHHMRGIFRFHVSQVTRILEVEKPEYIIPNIESTEIEEKIGATVAELVHDGDTIQLGIGGIPNAVGMALRRKNDLGIHTEMFTSSMMDLIKAGNITGMKKNIDTGLHVCSFAEGVRELYAFLQENEHCLIRPSSEVVSPYIIAQQNNFVSINTLVEIDLVGQVCAESIGPKQISGAGGAFCCALGAFESKGGRGILAFPSRTAKGQSKIKTMLTQGAVVTVPRNYVDYVVTEYGCVRLKGATVRERIERLISIAHPDDRDRLREEARRTWANIK